MLNKTYLLMVIASLVFLSVGKAQKNSNIYLTQMDSIGLHQFMFSAPVSIIPSNLPAGYNNQPFFDGNKIYYSSKRDGKQTDIYAYDRLTTQTTQITATPESEYSPQLMPDGVQLSCVRIETDGVTQRLCRLPLDGSAEPKVLMDSVFNVGYHVWLNSAELALFIVGQPHQLGIYNAWSQEKVKSINENVGRCIARTIHSEVSFTHDTREDEVYIKIYNPNTKRESRLVPILPESEDYAWLPDGSLLGGSGSHLYHFVPGHDSNWIEIANFAPFGINHITRISVRGDGLIAIVSDEM